MAQIPGRPVSGWWIHYNNPTVSFTPEPGVSYVAFFAAHGNWTNYNMMFEYVAVRYGV